MMRSLVEHSKDRELVLVDGVKVLHDDGWVLALPDPEEPVTHVWAEAAHRRRGPPPGPGVRPAHPPDDALSALARGSTSSRGFALRWGSVRAHGRARRPAVHQRPRVGQGRGHTGADRHHRLRAGRAGRRRVRPGPRGRRRRSSRGDGERGRVDQVGLRHLRPGDRHDRRGQRRPRRRARAAQRGPVRRGLDLRHRDRATRPSSTALLDADGLPRRWSRASGRRSARRDGRRLLQPVRPPEPAGLELLLVVRRAARRRPAEDRPTINFQLDAPSGEHQIEIDLDDVPGRRDAPRAAPARTPVRSSRSTRTS